MKLLFDENISYRILKKLDTIYIDSENIKGKPDKEIWEYAKENNFTIVTFDEDYYDIQLIKGFPPKVIWLRFGNSPTSYIADVINQKKDIILEFTTEPEIGILELY